MKIVVLGLWHLGCVTAACLAEAGHDIIGLDFDRPKVSRLQQGYAPLFEPGLEELIQRGMGKGNLTFATDPAVVAGADLLWVAYDTPVDDDDKADADWVHKQVRGCFEHLSDGAVVVISSQLPVGSVAALERDFAARGSGRTVHFACWPENLRLGQAIKAFTKADRIVLGVRSARAETLLQPLAGQFGGEAIVLSVESAEMSKHALNAFLALCIAFTNEVAGLCEQTGADAVEVERALRSDPRAGRHAYLKAGGPFAGGTLARDVSFLCDLGDRLGLSAELLRAIGPSNKNHSLWVRRRLMSHFGGNLKGRIVVLLGLTYKPGTSTIRRSMAIETARWLTEQEAEVRAFDPKVRQLPSDLGVSIHLASSIEEAIAGAEALVMATPWPEFRDLDGETLKRLSPGVAVLDQERFLERSLGEPSKFTYITVGKI